MKIMHKCITIINIYIKNGGTINTAKGIYMNTSFHLHGLKNLNSDYLYTHSYFIMTN